MPKRKRRPRSRTKRRRRSIRQIGRISSVSEYVRLISQLRLAWQRRDFGWSLWFRGEPPAVGETSLTPRLYRANKTVRQLLNVEQELRLEFKRCGLQLDPSMRHASHWEWYFMMQHHGVPTRLLDWTDSALVGLFFAVESTTRDSQGDAAIYVMDPEWLNKLTFRKNSNWSGVALTDWPAAERFLPDQEVDNAYLLIKRKNKNCLAIDPPHISTRLAAQRSRFVIFSLDSSTLQKACLRRDSKIVTIRVPASAARELRAELRLMGVSRSSVFPDLQGLGVSLKEQFDDWC